MDSDDEIEDFKSWKGVPGTIILINAFGNSRNNSFSVAHAATCRLIKQYLCLSGSHNVSVCVYGTEEPTAPAFDTKSVIEIFPLTMPTLEDFKKLRSFDISSYSEAKELKLSDALWHCSKTFSNFKKQLSSRSIIMLTELRSPPIPTDRKPTFKKVMDLVDSNVDIKIINISNKEYQMDQFYEHFLLEVNKGSEIKAPLPMWDVKEIERIMRQESHRHLAVAKLDFEIGSGLSIGVGIYSLLKRSGYTQNKQSYLDRDTNALVTNVTKTMKVTVPDAAGTEECVPKQVPILKSEILHFVEYGGERIEFTENEIKKIKNPFGSPMIKLLGFKPATVICKEKWYYKMSYFLFPNEGSIEGSTIAFRALHQACTEMSVVAICVLCTRVNSKPVIVALSPTTKPLGLDVEFGFDVVIIPYVETVRDISNVIEDDENISVDEASKSVMIDILNSMKFDYKPDMFENPKLQSQYRAVESIALEDDEVEPFIDTTHPDPKIYENIREDLFEEIFGPFGDLSIKRSAASSEPGSSKRMKVEDIDENLLANRIRTKKVNSFNVDQLKNILKSKNNKELPALTGLKKAELVDLVYKYCGD